MIPGEAINARILPNTPNALKVGARCAVEGYGFFWHPFTQKPVFKAPDGTPIECDVDENYIPIIRSKGTAKGRKGRPPRALPVASVQTDPAMDESTLSPAYSPRPMSVDRTPVVTPEAMAGGRG